MALGKVHTQNCPTAKSRRRTSDALGEGEICLGSSHVQHRALSFLEENHVHAFLAAAGSGHVRDLGTLCSHYIISGQTYILDSRLPRCRLAVERAACNFGKVKT